VEPFVSSVTQSSVTSGSESAAAAAKTAESESSKSGTESSSSSTAEKAQKQATGAAGKSAVINCVIVSKFETHIKNMKLPASLYETPNII
jgi:hypothetical protein